MRTFTALFLAAVLSSPVQAGDDCELLNAYDISEEDVSIILSVRRVQTDMPNTLLAKQLKSPEARTNESMQVCYLSVPNTDPQLSVEAGWDPVFKKINCKTGEVISLAHKTYDSKQVCLLSVPNTDPQLSVEAGWDPAFKKINCETGEVITLDPKHKSAVAG
jgi:hypothetical protein